MFAVIHLPQFALQAVLRHSLEDWEQPVALVDPAMSTPRVCDQTEPARQRGVELALTPTQALARCREVSIRHRSPTQETAVTDALLQCAYGFSPHIENTSRGIVTLDLRGLSELIEATRGPALTRTGILSTDAGMALTHWANRLHGALMSLQLTARLGVGLTPNIARHAALWAEDGNIGASRRCSGRRSPADGPSTNSGQAPSALIQIVNDPSAFIASLPVEALQPSTDVSNILTKWGIRTVGQFLALGQDAVMDRLGLEAIALFAAASVQTMRPLNLVRPVERYEEFFEFEQPVETIEPLLFLLNRFVAQLSQRLELGGLAAERLILRLQLESGENLERRLPVPQPTHRVDVLFRMLQTHLENVRTESPIQGVALSADPTRPEQKQFSLFDAALRDPQQFQETLARLSALVGADHVGTPVRENSHRPDAFRLVPPDFENAPTDIRPRVAEILRQTPLRRLRPSWPALVETAQPLARPGKSRNVGEARPSTHSPTPNIVELLGPLFTSPEARGVASGSEMTSTTPARSTTGDHAELNRNRQPLDLTPRPPVSLRCKLAHGKLTVALGPWRVSGRWWEPGAWERDEWDVQTRDGLALRLTRSGNEWRVEGMVD